MKLVFSLEKKVLDISGVQCGSVMIVAATLVIIRTRRGSRNGFAYILMTLTVIIGLTSIGNAFSDAMRVKIGDKLVASTLGYDSIICVYYIA